MRARRWWHMRWLRHKDAGTKGLRAWAPLHKSVMQPFGCVTPHPLYPVSGWKYSAISHLQREGRCKYFCLLDLAVDIS